MQNVKFRSEYTGSPRRFLVMLIATFMAVQVIIGFPAPRSHVELTQRRADSAPSLFPPKCPARDLAIVRFQLPEGDCVKFTTRRPEMNACSFSYATRCPEGDWFTNQYVSISERLYSKPPISIYVGCNKAMDAVNTLRMISGNASYDRSLWRDTLYEGQKVVPGVCKQDNAGQFDLESVSALPLGAVVHCIEAMPVTAERLLKASTTLGWQDHLVVSNIAMADFDGIALFPNVVNKVGTEDLGLGDCNRTGVSCKEVPMYRLDTYVKEMLPADNSLIDFLSIDAEGYDFEVLLGAPRALRRTKYLEFEYHWTGTWSNHTMSSAIDMLKGSGFVCYWAGDSNHLWRITDCFLDYYDKHAWSNVACVNVAIPQTAPLAARMEELFQMTLDAGKTIRYHNKYTANTETVVES